MVSVRGGVLIGELVLFIALLVVSTNAFGGYGVKRKVKAVFNVVNLSALLSFVLGIEVWLLLKLLSRLTTSITESSVPPYLPLSGGFAVVGGWALLLFLYLFQVTVTAKALLQITAGITAFVIVVGAVVAGLFGGVSQLM